jgi:DNA-binding response OmpR family regulator
MRPTILLVEPDDTVRPILVDNLRRWGYSVIVVLDTADAVQRTQHRGESFDLLLINQFVQSIEACIKDGRDICLQAGLPNTIPVVVMAERYGVELEGQDRQVGKSEYVTYLEDGQQLKRLLYQLCPI